MEDSDHRRLLLIAAEFPPRGGGGVLRVTKLVKYLSRLGWLITVVCSDEPSGETDDPALLEQVADAKIVRLRGPLRSVGATARHTIEASRNRRGGARCWDLARSSARAFAVPDRWIGWSLKVGRLRAEVVGDPDVIISSGPPHSAHLAARAQAHRLRVPYFMDLRDDWAGNPLFASRAPWRDPIDFRLERRTVNAAAGIVVVSEAAKTAYARRYPPMASRVHVITNGFDPDDMPTARPDRETPGPRDPVRFVHAGSMRYDRAGGDLIFDAFGAAVEADPTLRLHLLGSVSPSNAQRAESSVPPQNLSLDGFVPHEEALRRMAAADALVVISSATEAGAGTLTGKIFECLAVRRPILLISPPGPAADLVSQAGAGVVASPDDPEAIENGISAVADLARSREFRGASADILAAFDRRVHADVWSRILAASIGSGASPSAPTR